MSLELDILRCLSDERKAMTPLKIARWLIKNDPDYEDDDEDALRDAVEDELGDLETSDLVEKTGRNYEITDEGDEHLEESDAVPRVFLIHGHDHGLLAKCEKLIKKHFQDELEVVILMDEPDHGSESLFDKFKRHAPRDRDMAVALLTADDLAGAKGDINDLSHLRPRARQNVILELGYCYATIERERVWVLRDKGVEQPSDIVGGMYTSTSDQWMEKLRSNIRAALDEED